MPNNSFHFISSPASALLSVLRSAKIVNTENAAQWPSTTGTQPDAKGVSANFVTLYDTAGIVDGRLHRTGETVEHVGVLVRVRASDYNTGWAKAREISNFVDTIRRKIVTIDTEDLMIQSVSKSSPILPLGTEQGTSSRRELFTLNLLLTVTKHNKQ